MNIAQNLKNIKDSLPDHVALVAVSKTKPTEDIMEAYQAGQRIFGENKIQEMTEKHDVLPKDIEWHMIGHVQRNKVKYMAGFVSLIHGIDSLKLLKEVNKQALKHSRIIDCLLQIKIAEEDTKFGLSVDDARSLLLSEEVKALENICITGVMGMATFTKDIEQIKTEFTKLKTVFDEFRIQNSEFRIISMGMSSDYQTAIACGSNMVRVGSSIFGERNYN